LVANIGEARRLRMAGEFHEPVVARTRIGFDHYTIAHRGFTPLETLEFAQTHHFDGVQFLEPAAIDPALDGEELRAFRRRADVTGLYVEVGLPCPNPARRTRELGRQIDAAARARELRPHLHAIAALGCRHARLYVGDRHDRFRGDVSWPTQIAATLEVLRQLTSQLKELGIRLAVETHGDLTVSELILILEQLDPEIAGVTLDTGNLVMRLDDPVEATQRLAPHVVATHIKDAVLAFTARGLCWQARPIGSGILPLPDILAALIAANPGIALSIELHPRTYDLPIFERKWLAYFPQLKPESLAAVVRLAALCESRYADGTLPRPEPIEDIPWEKRDLDWLASSLGYLRSIVPRLERI
jgi:sugar phosphate isomerase/epimerase